MILAGAIVASALTLPSHTLASMDAARPKVVSVLMRPDCENGPRAVERVKSLAATMGLDVRVDEVNVTTIEQARKQGFLGSPTVRVSGEDVDPRMRGLAAAASYAMT